MLGDHEAFLDREGCEHRHHDVKLRIILSYFNQDHTLLNLDPAASNEGDCSQVVFGGSDS